MATPFAIGTLLGLSMLQGSPLIEAAPVWQGAVSTATTTEIRVRAASSTDVTVAFESGHQPAVVVSRQVPRNRIPVTFSVPLDPRVLGDVLLRYSVDDGPWADLHAGRLARSVGTVAVVGATAAQHLGHLSGLTIVAVADLPRLSASYDHITVLVVDRDALSRLDEPQLRAMLEHVGLCGRVLLIDPPAPVELLMRQRSGCDGRYLMAAGAGDDIGDVVHALASRSSSKLPDAYSLSNLMPRRDSDTRLMTIYLGGFLLIFITLTMMPRSRNIALGFSLLATLLSGLLWTGGNRTSFVAWAEVAGSERVARYTSLERASATGRGEQSLYLRSLSGSPMRILGDGLTLHWGQVARDRYFEWTPTLLQEMRVYSSGSFPVEGTLRAATTGDRVTVCNRGSGQTPPAFLHWRDTNYRVPPLASGARWSPEDSSITDESSAPLRMLKRRSSPGVATLMYRLDVPHNGGEQTAWLVRSEPVQLEASPCRV